MNLSRDWTTAPPPGMTKLIVEAQAVVGDCEVELCHLKWATPSTFAFSLGNHYLDYSMDTRPRSGVASLGRDGQGARPGDLIYIPPNRTYTAEAVSRERHLVCVALSERFLERMFDGQSPFEQLEACADIQSMALRRIFEGLAAELRSPGFASLALIESMMMGLAVEVSRILGSGSSADAPKRSNLQARRIADYVMANLAAPLSIADIARECNMSVRHVARVFKESMSISLGEFVTRNRIALAKELLRGEDAAIKEISWRCGFNSNSAFSAAFRAATGQTPKAFRSAAPLG